MKGTLISSSALTGRLFKMVVGGVAAALTVFFGNGTIVTADASPMYSTQLNAFDGEYEYNLCFSYAIADKGEYATIETEGTVYYIIDIVDVSDYYTKLDHAEMVSDFVGSTVIGWSDQTIKCGKCYILLDEGGTMYQILSDDSGNYYRL